MAKLNYDRVYRTQEPGKRTPSISDLETTEDLCALVKVQKLLKYEYGYVDINISVLVYDILKRIGQGETILEVYDND